jgi:hypothetical protein
MIMFDKTRKECSAKEKSTNGFLLINSGCPCSWCATLASEEIKQYEELRQKELKTIIALEQEVKELKAENEQLSIFNSPKIEALEAEKIQLAEIVIQNKSVIEKLKAENAELKKKCSTYKCETELFNLARNKTLENYKDICEENAQLKAQLQPVDKASATEFPSLKVWKHYICLNGLSSDPDQRFKEGLKLAQQVQIKTDAEYCEVSGVKLDDCKPERKPQNLDEIEKIYSKIEKIEKWIADFENLTSSQQHRHRFGD